MSFPNLFEPYQMGTALALPGIKSAWRDDSIDAIRDGFRVARTL